MARSQSFRSIFILLSVSLFIAACGGGGGGSTDRTPNAFNFTASPEAALAEPVESGTITVAGIETAVAISISGGEYSINDGAYTSSAGTVSQGQTVKVRLTASSEFATGATSTVTIGGVTGSYTVTTVSQDTTPENLVDFPSKTQQVRDDVVVSDPITVLDINDDAVVSVSTGGEYSIGAEDFTSGDGEITSGQTIRVRLTAASGFSSPESVTLTIGGVESVFTATTLPQDTTPETLDDFAPKATQGLGAQVVSDSITISNINDVTAISVSAGGEYSINGGAFTNESGQVSSGQTVVIRLTASLAFSTQTVVTLTVGGVESEFTATTLLQDTVPETLVDFASIDTQALEDVVNSVGVTISNINDAADVTVTDGAYSIGSGGFTTSAGQILSGQSIRVQVTTSELFSTPATVTLTVGGVEASFTATTAARDVIPRAFIFSDETDADLSTLIPSDSITVSEINDASPISVSAGGEYSIDGGTFTSSAGNVSDGQSVQVRATSSPSVSTGVNVTLTIGGVNDIFTITTIADTTAPTVVIAFPPPASMTEGATVTVRGTASDDYSTINSLQVNGINVTDNSGDSSFSTWSVSVPLADGEDNTLTVSVVDSASVPNTDANAASVMVRRDGALGDFPDSVNPLSYPTGIAIDYSRNRALISDRDLDTIFTMDLATGARGILSNSSTADVAFPFFSPEGLLVDAANDRLWVADFSADTIFSVSLANGIRSVVSSDTVPNTTLPFQAPREMVVNPNNSDELFIADQGQGVKSININTGERAVFSDDPIPNDLNRTSSVKGIVVDIARNRLLVADDFGNTGRMVAMDLDTGERTYISTSTIPNSDAPLLGDLRTIALDLDRNRALLNNRDALSLIAVDLDSGVRSMFSDATFPDAINAAVFPQEVFFDGNLGYAFWIDRTLDAVLAVDILSGERVFVTRGDSVD